MFSSETLDFLLENQFHNDREWFREHKADFQRLVYDPLAALVRDLAPAVSAADPEIVTEAKTDRTISRIYRDTRFSKDKSLYRSHMWLTFKRDKKAFPGFPEFFFVITPEGFTIGSGYYCPSEDAVNHIRRRILAGDPGFLRAKAVLDAEPVYRLGGDCYKRTRHPDAPEELRCWLDRKSYYAERHSEDFELLYSPELGKQLIRDIEQLTPVYQFFLETELSLLVERYRQ